MSNKKGLKALSPLILLVILIAVFTVYATGKSSSEPNLSLTVAFLIASIYAVIVSGGFPLKSRIDAYSQGAGNTNLMLMLWIYVLAGAFAATAKAIGAIDSTVNITLWLLPSNMLMPGLFLAACFISLAIGTSVGTVVALVPIALGIAHSMGASAPLFVAIVVGGAYFGDNLSFISDTTVAATQTQQCKMSDKFRVNALIVTPAALLVLMVYAFMGRNITEVPHAGPISLIKAVPYLAVLITAVCGINVMAVLTIGLVLCGIIGVLTGSFNIYGFFASTGDGVLGMGELVIIAMMAGGMLEIIRRNGGIDYIIERLTAHISTKRGAEFTIALLVSLINVCTANNTVAILTVGPIAKQLGDKYGVDNRKAASILDTFSCIVQALLPYGAQMLLAAGLSGISPMLILPYLYYPMAMGIMALLAIALRYPKKYS